MRQPGYYWVKYKGEWIIANFTKNDGWYTIENGVQKIDNYFDEIDEHQITRE